MKKNQSSALLPLGRICAAFSLLGSWQENKAALLGIGVVVAAVLALFFWLSHRRRQNSSSDSLIGAPPSPATDAEAAVPPRTDGGITQFESLPEMPESGAIPSSRPSPGLHGKIEVLVGGQQISSYLITDNPLPIGRDPAQALVIIQEPIVSKLHCQIYTRGGQVFVKDFNSTNGIYINDKKVSECELRDNDEVFLGRKGTIRLVYHR